MITGIFNRQNSIEKELINELSQLDNELNQLEKGGEIKKEAKERDKTQLRTVLLERIKAFRQKANENNQSKLSEKADGVLKNLFIYEFNQLKAEFQNVTHINKEDKEEDKILSKAAVIEKMQFFCEKAKNNNQVQLFKRMNEFLGIALSKDDKEAALKYWENAEEYGSIHLAMNDLKGLSKDNPQDENRKKIQRSIIILKKYLPKKNETKCHHEKISKCEDCGAAKALLASIYLNNLEKSRKVNAKNLLEEARATGIDIPRIIKAILLRDGCPQHDIERDEIASFELLKEYENENVLRENDSRHGRMWYLLGICYQDGRGVAKDKDKGNKYLEIADKLGFKPLNNGFFNDAPSSLPVQQVTTEEKPKTASQKPSIGKTRSKKTPAENPVIRTVKSIVLSRPVVWVGTTFLVTPTKWVWTQITSACQRKKTQPITNWEETTLQSTESTEKENKSEKQTRKKKSKSGSSGRALTAKSKAISSSTPQKTHTSLVKPNLKTPVIVIPKASETSLTAKDSPKPIVKASENSPTSAIAATLTDLSEKVDASISADAKSSEAIQQTSLPHSPTKITGNLNRGSSSPDANKVVLKADVMRGSTTPDVSPLLATKKIEPVVAVASDPVNLSTTIDQQPIPTQSLPLKTETKEKTTATQTIIKPFESKDTTESKALVYEAAKLIPLEKIPPRVKEILWTLYEKKHEAELTGGAIRDLILDAKSTPSDWDTATSASIKTMMGYFPPQIKDGSQINVITIEDKAGEIEITPFHKHETTLKGYTRLVESTDSEPIFEDSPSVRDAPINWMSFRIKKGSTKENVTYEIIDRSGQGLKDLKAGVVQAITDPTAAIQRDWMLMIRFIYLANKLRPNTEQTKSPYFKLTEKTQSAIKTNANKLQNLRDTNKYFQLFGYLLKIIALEPLRRISCLEDLNKYGLLDEMLTQIVDGFNKFYEQTGISHRVDKTKLNELLNDLKDNYSTDVTKKLHSLLQKGDLIGIVILLCAGADPQLLVENMDALQKLEVLKTDPNNLNTLAVYKEIVSKLLNVPKTADGTADPKKIKDLFIGLLNEVKLKNIKAKELLLAQQTNPQQLAACTYTYTQIFVPTTHGAIPGVLVTPAVLAPTPALPINSSPNAALVHTTRRSENITHPAPKI